MNIFLLLKAKVGKNFMIGHTHKSQPVIAASRLVITELYLYCVS